MSEPSSSPPTAAPPPPAPRASASALHAARSASLRFAVWLVMVAVVVQSVRTIEIIPEFLLRCARRRWPDMLVRMWPLDSAYYPKQIHQALMETLHIASLGTMLSVLMAVPFGLLVARNLTRSRAVNFAARVALVTSRSVNSLVWALLFVAVFGPGPLAGTLAIAFRSIGFVGKLLGEAIEQAPRGPIEALEAAGAGWFARIGYGYWPQVKPAFASIVLLRWDINVRESAVLGLVGAGGIGMVLDSAMNLFQWDRVAMMLLAIFAVVVVAEVVVTQVRRRVL
ncbi:MAG: phosphonate ABC transporter, permease protein PhnE [Pseudomonas sp.]